MTGTLGHNLKVAVEDICPAPLEYSIATMACEASDNLAEDIGDIFNNIIDISNEYHQHEYSNDTLYDPRNDGDDTAIAGVQSSGDCVEVF